MPPAGMRGMVAPMSRMAILVLLSCVAAPAAAQGAAVEVEAQAPAGPEAEAQAATPSGPLTIATAVLPGRRVDAELVAAVDEALAAQIGPFLAGRPLARLNGAAAVYENLSGCSDDACVGNQLAVANAQVGVVVRLERGRRDLSVTIELRGPVSGALQGEPIQGSIPRDAATLAEALAPLSAQLEASLPPPPPPPATLLVTVNVDDARVQIDGQDIGASPVAAVQVAPGSHEVIVLAQGYASARRTTEVVAGQQARLDITVREIGAEAAAAAGVGTGPAADPNNAWAQPSGEGSGDITGEWWFWTIIGAGAAVLIGVAIGIGVAVSQPGAPAQPEGIRLPPIEGGI